MEFDTYLINKYTFGMEKENNFEIIKQRTYKVVKANDMIQKARYDLNITELKILAFILSKVKPTDLALQEYVISIKDFCLIAGIDYKSGKNYNHIKATLKALRDKSFWIEENGTEILVGWLQKAKINKGSGNISVKLDEDIQKYVIGLYSNFTEYQLLSTLPFTSKFSFRIFELLKSYAFKGKEVFDIDVLKRKLAAEHYKNYSDFKRYVLEVAKNEINLYTDINIEYKAIYKGRRVGEIAFYIKQLDSWGQVKADRKALEEIDGQLTVWDFYNE